MNWFWVRAMPSIKNFKTKRTRATVRALSLSLSIPLFSIDLYLFILIIISTETVIKIKEKATRRKGRGFGPGLYFFIFINFVSSLMSNILIEGTAREDIREYEAMDVSDGHSDEPGPQKCI